jgi:hypothetical protein
LKAFGVGIFLICPVIYFEELFDHDEFRDVQHGPHDIDTRCLGPGSLGC